MFTRCRLFLLLAALPALAQVTIAPELIVRNAATGRTIVAPGSLISITPLAPRQSSLAGSTVELQIGTETRYTLDIIGFTGGRNMAVIPASAPLGQGIVTLKQGEDSYTDRIVIERTAPGLFAEGYNSSGPALAINYTGPGLPVKNALTRAAVPGTFVSLFGTGLNGALASDVTVEVAGRPTAADSVATRTGVDQINFVLPADAYLGCYVPVSLRVRGVLSNAVTLSINSDTHACAHPLGLSYSDLLALDRGGTIPLVSASISSYREVFELWIEVARFLFLQADASTVAVYAGQQMPDSAYFTCSSTEAAGVFARVGQLGPEAGDPVTFAGPNGQRLELGPPYIGIAPAGTRFFTPGMWQVSAPGGTNVLSFAQSFRLPPAITSIRVRSLAAVSTPEVVEVSWDTAGFTLDDVVTAQVGTTMCRARALDGRLTIPKPPPSLVALRIAMTVNPHPAGRVQFPVLRRDGYRQLATINYGFSVSLPFPQ